MIFAEKLADLYIDRNNSETLHHAHFCNSISLLTTNLMLLSEKLIKVISLQNVLAFMYSLCNRAVFFSISK